MGLSIEFQDATQSIAVGQRFKRIALIELKLNWKVSYIALQSLRAVGGLKKLFVPALNDRRCSDT